MKVRVDQNSGKQCPFNVRRAPNSRCSLVNSQRRAQSPAEPSGKGRRVRRLSSAPVLFSTAAPLSKLYARGMTTLNARSAAVCVCAMLSGFSHLASAQDLSRYREVAFGSSVSSVVTITGTSAAAVKVIHQRPALIQELAWRPQYAIGRPVGRSEAAREVTYRFADDKLFRIVVVYDARLVEGLTNADLIDAVSAVY